MNGSFRIDPLHDVSKPKQDLRLRKRYTLPDQYTCIFHNAKNGGYSVTTLVAFFIIRETTVPWHTVGARTQKNHLARIQYASLDNIAGFYVRS